MIDPNKKIVKKYAVNTNFELNRLCFVIIFQ